MENGTFLSDDSHFIIVIFKHFYLQIIFSSIFHKFLIYILLFNPFVEGPTMFFFLFIFLFGFGFSFIIIALIFKYSLARKIVLFAFNYKCFCHNYNRPWFVYFLSPKLSNNKSQSGSNLNIFFKTFISHG